MADLSADGKSDECGGKQQRWNRASQEVRNIIQMVKTTLEKNDAMVQSTPARAKAAVAP